MGGALGLGEGGAVGAIDGGEERVLAVRIEPAFADGFAGEAHGVGRLVAGYAGAAVGAEGYEEGMAAGAERTVGVGDAEQAGGVVVFAIPGEEFLLIGLPPGVAGAVGVLGEGGGGGQEQDEEAAHDDLRSGAAVRRRGRVWKRKIRVAWWVYFLADGSQPGSEADWRIQAVSWASSSASFSWMSSQRASLERGVWPGGTGFRAMPLKNVTLT